MILLICSVSTPGTILLICSFVASVPGDDFVNLFGFDAGDDFVNLFDLRREMILLICSVCVSGWCC